MRVFPHASVVYRALELTPITTVQVVILGQDPYYREGQADGLAFSVPVGVKLPPSLVTIYKEIERSCNVKKDYTSGDLSQWATEGVLLLNSALTVEEGRPGSHRKRWAATTDAIIEEISQTREHVVFMLWGNFARSKKRLIDTTKHLVLEAVHPSPLSAYRGFIGCDHFVRANEYLAQHGGKPIVW